MHQLNGERLSVGGTCDKISESVLNLYQAAVSSNQSLRRVAIDPSDHFFLPSSVENRENKAVGSVQGKQDRSIRLQDQPSISAHTVLGQLLFDVCVPKNIEDWDIKPVDSLNRHTFGSSHRHYPNPIRSIRRSKLWDSWLKRDVLHNTGDLASWKYARAMFKHLRQRSLWVGTPQMLTMTNERGWCFF